MALRSVHARGLALAFVALATSSSSATRADEPSARRRAPRTELWAGRYVLEAEEKLPVVGTVRLQSERFVLATVVDDGDVLELVERPCAIRLATIAGVTLKTRDENARELPAVTVRYARFGDEWRAAPWRSIVGRDGPHLEVEVRAPLCGTMLHVASDTRSSARARDRRDGRRGLEGLVRARALQLVRDPSGACLGAREHKSDQRFSGRFTFVAVDPGATCASLGTWPEVPGANFALDRGERARPREDYGEW
ncbi:hypothetical protein L6R52_36830 [Myxococcota bacterium]|nr:hypothetical protein [Myxococcota bacterium]